MTEEENPYAPPPEPVAAPWGSGYVPPLPLAGARPPDVPPRPALDPWTVRGWSSRGAAPVRVLAAVAAFAVLALPIAVASAADELAYQRDVHAHYVRATGAVVPEPDLPYVTRFEGTAPGLGYVVVPLDYGEVEPGAIDSLLVDKGEPTDYVLPWDEPHPGVAVSALVTFAALAIVTGAVAWHLASRRAYDAEHLRAVATPVTSGPRVPLGTPPSRRGRLLLAAVPAGVLALSAVGLATASHAMSENPRTVAVIGTATRASDGTTVLRFESADGSDVERPLTGAEADITPGSTKRVLYRVGDPGHGDAVFLLTVSVLGAVLSLLALLHLARGARTGAAARDRARLVPAVVWTRVARGRSWLVVLPDGASRPVVVPVERTLAVPAAFAGGVWVHGTPRRGRVAIVHDPEGAPLWPAGACRGAFAATLTAIDPVPPRPPYGYTGA